MQLNSVDKKIVCLAGLGGMLELYDFVIYGIFSVYFAHQFFPAHNTMLSVINSYIVFVLGYMARPLGGLIFSHFGDEYGRKQVLIITIVLMGASSLGIGLLPTYEQIGIVAPLLLMCLRLLQGFALGGELPCTYVYISESIPEKQGTAFGITMSGVNCGLLLGMLINHVLNLTLSKHALHAYGWRIPFILGGLLCLISYRIRKSLYETAAFKKRHDIPAFPLAFLLEHHLKATVTGTLLASIMSGLVVVGMIFMPSYLHDILHIDNALISAIMPIVSLFNIAAIYYTGQLANRWPPKQILKCLLLFGIVLIPLSYGLMYLKQGLLLPGLICLGMLEGVAAMLIPCLICTLFPASVRLTGVALSYNLSFTLFGGLAPIIITTLISHGAEPYLTPMLYLLMLIVICATGQQMMKHRISK